MSIIDFHSHILPGIDDGSKNVDTSLDMLRKASAQRVDVMVATPHFYAEKESVEAFIRKRNQSYENIKQFLPEDAPRVLLGAEVAFFYGISKAEKIDQLLIQDTDILLLEMPFDIWTSSDIEEVKEIVSKKKIRVMLAHLERFTKISKNKKLIKELLTLPVIVQVNAGSLLDGARCRETIKLLKKSQNYVLGSDCHGSDYRPPNLLDGRNILREKMGKETLHQIDIFGMESLSMIGR